MGHRNRTRRREQASKRNRLPAKGIPTTDRYAFIYHIRPAQDRDRQREQVTL